MESTLRFGRIIESTVRLWHMLNTYSELHLEQEWFHLEVVLQNNLTLSLVCRIWPENLSFLVKGVYPEQKLCNVVTCPETMLKRTSCHFCWTKNKMFIEEVWIWFCFSLQQLFSREGRVRFMLKQIKSFCGEANRTLLETGTESVEHTIVLGITLHGRKSLWAKPATTCLTIDMSTIELLTKKKRIIWTAQQSVATFRLSTRTTTNYGLSAPKFERPWFEHPTSWF